MKALAGVRYTGDQVGAVPVPLSHYASCNDWRGSCSATHGQAVAQPTVSDASQPGKEGGEVLESAEGPALQRGQTETFLAHRSSMHAQLHWGQ